MGGFGTQVHVGGDVLGQLVVGDHNVTVWAEQSVVTVVAPGEQPRPLRRDAVRLLPRLAGVPMGRTAELDGLDQAILAGRLVQVYGVPGAGKSTLVRHAAGRMTGDTSGVVFLSAAGRDVTDVLQDVFEACYDAPGYRPGPVELRRLMAGVGIRVVLDDLDVTSDQRDMLLDGLPDATVLFTSTERTLWTDGQALALSGLDHDTGLALLAHAMGRPLREDELPAARELWRVGEGSPQLLLRAVAGARRAPDGTLTLPHPAELGGLLPRILAMLTGPARDMASLLALAGPAGVASGLLPWLVADPAVVPMVTAELVALGVAVPTDSGHQLAPGLDVMLPLELTAGPPQLEWLVFRLREWARARQFPPIAVANHATLIARTIDAAVRMGRPDLGAHLARDVAPAAACSLRMGAWEQILLRGIAAAELAQDRATLAYLTHEDGIRNLVTGRRVAAVAAIGVAATIWHELGDTAHLALAQHFHTVTGTAMSSPLGGGTAATVHTGAHAAATQTMAGNTAAVHGVATGGHTASTMLAVKGTGLGVKAGIGIGAKLAIAGAAAVVVGGAVVGATVLSHRHGTPPAAAPVAVAAPQLVGTQLAPLLLSANEFPGGFSAAESQRDDSGSSLSAATYAHGLVGANCVGLYGDDTAGDNPLTSGPGESAYAVLDMDSGGPTGDTPGYGVHEGIYQFRTPAGASAFFGQLRTVLTGCVDAKTGKPTGSAVDAAEVGGRPAITADFYQPITNAGGGVNPITSTSPFYVLSGADIYDITSTEYAGVNPSLETPTMTGRPSMITALIGRVASAGSGKAIPVPSETTDPPTTTVAPDIPVTTTDPGPAGVVEAYVAAINAHDYHAAWTLGGQHTGESYSKFASGFTETDHDVLTVRSVTGNTVVADLTSFQTDGTHHTFHGTYTVTGGTISHSSVRQTG